MILIKHFLLWIFYVWACTHFFLYHYGLHSLKVLDNKWCWFHYVCIMWKEAIERFSEPKKDRCNILLNVLTMYFSFWLKPYFDMCFDNLIQIYASHHCYITQAIWQQTMHWTCFRWHGYLCFEREKINPQHLKPKYLSNYLNNMEQKIKKNLKMQFNSKENDQIMIEKIYLQTIFFWKFPHLTFFFK